MNQGRSFFAVLAVCLPVASTAVAQPVVNGVVILDFEGDVSSGSLEPSALPINGLQAADLDATFAGANGALQDGAGAAIPLGTPLLVNPGSENLFVSLGADAGALTTVSLTISEITGDGFIGPGVGDADDTFDGVAATEVAADFYEFSAGTSVTFTYNDLIPGGLYTIASFSSNTAAGIDGDNGGEATVAGTTVPFLPGMVDTPGVGTLFDFVDVAAEADGSLDVTFAAPNAGSTFVSGFFIVGDFFAVPEPSSAILAATGLLAVARRRR